MSTLQIIILPLFVYFLAMVSPGQNFFIVTYTAVNSGLKFGVISALGVATGSFAYAIFAIFGYQVIVANFPNFLFYLQVLGALYLLYIGFKTVTAKTLASSSPMNSQRLDYIATYSKGLMVNLSNPKSILFFTSIFGIYLPAQAENFIAISLIICIAMLSIVWHCSLAYLFSVDRCREIYNRKQRLFNIGAGSLLIVMSLVIIIRIVNPPLIF